MKNGSVYIAFVNYYHTIISSTAKATLCGTSVPGYSYIAVTIPLMIMECRFQVLSHPRITHRTDR